MVANLSQCQRAVTSNVTYDICGVQVMVSVFTSEEAVCQLYVDKHDD